MVFVNMTVFMFVCYLELLIKHALLYRSSHNTLSLLQLIRRVIDPHLQTAMRFLLLGFFLIAVTPRIWSLPATAASEPPNIVITIKTTTSNHKTRLASLVATWLANTLFDVSLQAVA